MQAMLCRSRGGRVRNGNISPTGTPASNHSMHSAGQHAPAPPCIAGYRLGCSGLPTSQMHSSPSAPPLASRLGLHGKIIHERWEVRGRAGHVAPARQHTGQAFPQICPLHSSSTATTHSNSAHCAPECIELQALHRPRVLLQPRQQLPAGRRRAGGRCSSDFGKSDQRETQLSCCCGASRQATAAKQ